MPGIIRARVTVKTMPLVKGAAELVMEPVSSARMAVGPKMGRERSRMTIRYTSSARPATARPFFCSGVRLVDSVSKSYRASS